MPDTLLFLATCPHCGESFHTEYTPAPSAPALPAPRRQWRGRDATAADLDGLSEAEQLRLMIERFSRSSAPDETAVIVEYAMEKLKEIERGRAIVASADDALSDDVEAVAHLDEPTLADISEVLTGDRYYSGGTYKRLKRVQAALSSSSDLEKEAGEVEESDYAA